MYETQVVIFVGIIAAVAGLLIGAGLYRSVGSSAARVRRLKRALESAEAQNSQYQQDVAEHFNQTSKLLNDMTLQYKSIHDHLAAGADKLCRDPAGHSLLAGAPMRLSIEERRKDQEGRLKHDEANLRPPLDYAPKSETRSGTLSEEYGLEKVRFFGPPDAGPADSASADTGSTDAASASVRPHPGKLSSA